VLHSATWLTDGHVAFNWQGSDDLPTDVSLVWDENAAGVPVNHTE
jgi:hypothetical protein